MTGDEHKAELPTPPPDNSGEKHGVPFGAPTSRDQARGKLVSAIRAAERERIDRFQQLQEEIAGLDREHTDRITVAWRRYDEDLARSGRAE